MATRGTEDRQAETTYGRRGGRPERAGAALGKGEILAVTPANTYPLVFLIPFRL